MPVLKCILLYHSVTMRVNDLGDDTEQGEIIQDTRMDGIVLYTYFENHGMSDCAIV